jgi:RHS repeat-associated protein
MKQHKKVSYNGGILKRHDEESKRSVFKRFMAGETMAALVRETGVNKETYTFDRYGNRRFDEGQTTTLPRNCGTPQNPTICPEDVARLNPEINPANNRLSSPGWQYDAAGNTVRDAESRRFIYDGENKQVKVETVDANGNPTATIGQYFFDGDGKRIKKIVPATGEVTVFVYDASGKSIAEYSTVVEPVETAKVAYLTADHLGSPRINTDRDGNVTSRRDFHPFGEQIYTFQRTTGLGYDSDSVRKQFTGYERDTETDLDFAQARMHSYDLGRFTSPDPLYFQRAMVADPQRFNLFVYARNNTLKWIDPDGEKVRIASGSSLEELYQSVGGRENFAKYFELDNGMILVKEGVDLNGVNAGIQLLANAIGHSETFVFYSGNDGTEFAKLFEGATNEEGKLTKLGREIRDTFNRRGYVFRTKGRNQAAQPADGDFAIIGINPTQIALEQTGVNGDVEVEAQRSGLNQMVQPVSLFIHELAENLDFATNGVGLPSPDRSLDKKKATRALYRQQLADSRTSQLESYRRAHNYAIRIEAQIRRDITTINGGFAGGCLNGGC